MTEKFELDRQNDPTGLAESARIASGERPYLGDVEAIDKILRQFTAGILARFDEVGHGLKTPADAADADRAECERLAAVFTGADPAYAAVPGWSTGALARSVAAKLNELSHAGADAEVMAQAFAVFVHKVYGVINSFDGPGAESAMQDELNEDIRSFTWLLVGLDSNE